MGGEGEKIVGCMCDAKVMFGCGKRNNINKNKRQIILKRKNKV